MTTGFYSDIKDIKLKFGMVNAPQETTNKSIVIQIIGLYLISLALYQYITEAMMFKSAAKLMDIDTDNMIAVSKMVHELIP